MTEAQHMVSRKEIQITRLKAVKKSLPIEQSCTSDSAAKLCRDVHRRP